MHINKIIDIVGFNPISKTISDLNKTKPSKFLTCGANIRHIPKEKLTDKYIEMAIKSGNPVLQYIDNPSDKHIDLALKHCGYNIRYVPKDKITPERELMAVTGSNRGSNIKFMENPRDELIIRAIKSGEKLYMLQLYYGISDDVSDDVLEVDLKRHCTKEIQRKYAKRISESPRLRKAMLTNRFNERIVISLDWTIEEQKIYVDSPTYYPMQNIVTSVEVIPYIFEKKKFAFLHYIDISDELFFSLLKSDDDFKSYLIECGEDVFSDASYHFVKIIKRNPEFAEHLFNFDVNAYPLLTNPTSEQTKAYIKSTKQCFLRNRVSFTEEFLRFAFECHGKDVLKYVDFEHFTFDYNYSPDNKKTTFSTSQIKELVSSGKIKMIDCDVDVDEFEDFEIEIDNTKRGFHVYENGDLVFLCKGKNIVAIISIYDLYSVHLNGNTLLITGHENVITVNTRTLEYTNNYTR